MRNRSQRPSGICAPSTDHANLYFYRGVDLDDGTGLLQGGGKLMRSITLRKPADAERAEVKSLVRKAFQMAAS